MTNLLVIGFGGFFGALARYGLGGLVRRHAGDAFPWGTLSVNVLGCFLIGAVMTLFEERRLISPGSTRVSGHRTSGVVHDLLHIRI